MKVFYGLFKKVLLILLLNIIYWNIIFIFNKVNSLAYIFFQEWLSINALKILIFFAPSDYDNYMLKYKNMRINIVFIWSLSI